MVYNLEFIGAVAKSSSNDIDWGKQSFLVIFLSILIPNKQSTVPKITNFQEL